MELFFILSHVSKSSSIFIQKVESFFEIFSKLYDDLTSYLYMFFFSNNLKLKGTFFFDT